MSKPQVFNAAAQRLAVNLQTRLLLFRLANFPGSLELSAVSPAFKVKPYMSFCPDGEGICK